MPTRLLLGGGVQHRVVRARHWKPRPNPTATDQHTNQSINQHTHLGEVNLVEHGGRLLDHHLPVGAHAVEALGDDGALRLLELGMIYIYYLVWVLFLFY